MTQGSTRKFFVNGDLRPAETMAASICLASGLSCDA